MALLCVRDHTNLAVPPSPGGAALLSTQGSRSAGDQRRRSARLFCRWPEPCCPAGVVRATPCGGALYIAQHKAGQHEDSRRTHQGRPSRDDLAEPAKTAFAYFRDRYLYLTATTDDVTIAFRDDQERFRACPQVAAQVSDGERLGLATLYAVAQL